MYFIYIDESGNPDPNVELGTRPDNSTFERDWLFVMVPVSLFERCWFGFEKTINERKLALMNGITRTSGIRLDPGEQGLSAPGPDARPPHRRPRDLVARA